MKNPIHALAGAILLSTLALLPACQPTETEGCDIVAADPAPADSGPDVPPTIACVPCQSNADCTGGLQCADDDANPGTPNVCTTPYDPAAGCPSGSHGDFSVGTFCLCSHCRTAASSWHIAIEQNPMTTSCGAQTGIPIGAATDCAGATSVAQGVFTPAIADCVQPDCVAMLEGAYPGLAIGNASDVQVVTGAATCTVDPYVSNGNPFIRYQVTIPFQCEYCTPDLPPNPCAACQTNADCTGGLMCGDDDANPATPKICTRPYAADVGCPPGMHGNTAIGSLCICDHCNAASTSWHVAIEEHPMLTNCGNQTNIPVGAALSCPAAIAAAQTLFTPAIADCLKPGCEGVLEGAFPWLAVGSLADVTIVPGAATCTVDPYTSANGNPFIRYQVDLPFQCVYCQPDVPANPCAPCQADTDCGGGLKCADDDNDPATPKVCTTLYLPDTGCPSGQHGDYAVSKYCICNQCKTAGSSWHIAIEQNLMSTSCGSLTNIAVGAATDCSGATSVAISLFNPTILNCLQPDCEAMLEGAFPGLVITDPSTVSIVQGTAGCVVDPYVINGNPRTRYQVSVPYQCEYCPPPADQNPCHKCETDADCAGGLQCADDDNNPATPRVCTKPYMPATGCPAGMHGDYNVSKYCICETCGGVLNPTCTAVACPLATGAGECRLVQDKCQCLPPPPPPNPCRACDTDADCTGGLLCADDDNNPLTPKVCTTVYQPAVGCGKGQHGDYNVSKYCICDRCGDLFNPKCEAVPCLAGVATGVCRIVEKTCECQPIVPGPNPCETCDSDLDCTGGLACLDDDNSPLTPRVCSAPYVVGTACPSDTYGDFDISKICICDRFCGAVFNPTCVSRECKLPGGQAAKCTTDASGNCGCG